MVQWALMRIRVDVSPPGIPDGEFTSFGATIDPNDTLLQSLDDQEGVERLYSKEPDFGILPPV